MISTRLALKLFVPAWWQTNDDRSRTSLLNAIELHLCKRRRQCRANWIRSGMPLRSFWAEILLRFLIAHIPRIKLHNSAMRTSPWTQSLFTFKYFSLHPLRNPLHISVNRFCDSTPSYYTSASPKAGKQFGNRSLGGARIGRGWLFTGSGCPDDPTRSEIKLISRANQSVNGDTSGSGPEDYPVSRPQTTHGDGEKIDRILGYRVGRMHV